MNDKEFLMWIHDRLELVHGDNRWCDFMWRLRTISAWIPPDVTEPPPATPQTAKEGE